VRTYRFDDVTAVRPVAIAKTRVNLIPGAVQLLVDRNDDRMKWIIRCRANDDGKALQAGLHERANRKKGHRVDERLHEGGVQLVPRDSRQDETRPFWRCRRLIGPRAGNGLVDVGDGNDLTHRMRNDAVAEVGIPEALHRPMMFERDDRGERAQTIELHEDLSAESRMRLHQLPLMLVEGTRLLDDFKRNAGLADVVQQRGFDERRERILVQTHAPAKQHAQHRDVHRVHVSEVLVLLDRQNLAERGVAPGNLEHQQLHQVTYRGCFQWFA
jgi:hypothetical protein